jgi:hypothetical protein
MTMNALKLTSKMIAALMLSATMGGCAVAAGTGEEAEEHTSAATGVESKTGTEARATSTETSGTAAESTTPESAPVGNGGGVSPDPNPEPWQPPTVSTTRSIPGKPMPKSQDLPQ